MGAMRRARSSSPTPDCRDGIFAVFEKISPPVRPTIRAYMPPSVATSQTVKAGADGVWGDLCAMQLLGPQRGTLHRYRDRGA